MTRQEAIAAGAKRYIGRPCKHGHESGERWLVNGDCVKCSYERGNARAKADPAAQREKVRAYRKAHPAKVRKWKRNARRRAQGLKPTGQTIEKPRNTNGENF